MKIFNIMLWFAIMTKNLYILIILLNTAFITAQYTPQRPFEKVTFENVTPVYHSTFYDADFTTLGSDGYNCFNDLNTAEPLIYENLLFSINFNGIASNSTFGNYYITCLNLDNGTIKWRKKVFLEDNPNMEIPRLLKVNENKQLEIIGQKQINPFVDRSEFGDLILFKRTYTIEDGAFISLNHRPFNDPNAYQMFYRFNDNNLFFEDENKELRVMEKFELDGKVGYKFISLDETGALRKEPDTIMYKYFDDFVNGHNILPVGSDSLVMMEIGFDDDDDAFIALRYLTYDLVQIDELRIKSPVVENLPYIKLVGISPDKTKLLLNVWQFPDEVFNEEHSLSLIVDKKGSFLNQVRTEISGGVNYEWYTDENVIHRYGSKLRITDRVNPTQNSIFFSANKNDFETEILKEYTIQDSTRFAGIFRLFRYRDLEIAFLSETSYIPSEFVYGLDFPALAISILAFKKGDFIPEGILSKTSNSDLKDLATIKTYPNPSSGLLTLDIKGIIGKADIHIFDMRGHNVYMQRGITNGDSTMDLSRLSVGTYVYKIYQDSKEVGSGHWIKL